ncbi:MAG: RNA polymerase sigma factor [Candidatus Didemnitutus sp.]|nr:RNA polymerase sigma factor [Candidatus Didemnitutus sp.]
MSSNSRVAQSSGEQDMDEISSFPQTSASEPPRSAGADEDADDSCAFALALNDGATSPHPVAMPHTPEHRRWFSEEVQPHEPILRSYLRGSFPAVRDVDDVVQESYLRIWRTHLSTPVRSARAFLFTVARRLALDWVRRNRTAPFLSEREAGGLEVVEEKPSAQEQIDTEEKIEVLAEGLVALPRRCRDVIVLYRLKGLPRQEVAQRLGISPKTVDEQAARGVRRLEEFFRAQGYQRLFER